MSRLQRIERVITGVGMIAAAIALLCGTEDSVLKMITMLVAAYLFLIGVRCAVYYFTMARHMVGGKAMLFASMILLDFSFFTMTMVDESMLIIFLYLVGLRVLSGVIAILRSRESRKYKGPWVLNLLYGVGNILLAVLCFVFSESAYLLTWVFCAGLVYSAALRIISAFRRTEIVFIQ